MLYAFFLFMLWPWVAYPFLIEDWVHNLRQTNVYKLNILWLWFPLSSWCFHTSQHMKVTVRGKKYMHLEQEGPRSFSKSARAGRATKSSIHDWDCPHGYETHGCASKVVQLAMKVPGAFRNARSRNESIQENESPRCLKESARSRNEIHA